jgi:Ran GTPase-activating protein (RanGAP) involved in mRNA processing and transport
VTKVLPNLTKLDLTYGVKQIGMKYERMLFGMKISDATSIAKAIKDSETLTTLVLSSNLLDDDLLRMLMTGLIKNNSITYLDVSHNKITNHGARLLSKLLGSKSVLTSLNVCDNQIHAEGGRYLGRGLRHNDSLTDLNLRLNRLTDEGGRMLFDGLRDNVTLTNINLSSNSIGAESIQSLASLLREPTSPLCAMDLSANDLEESDISVLQNAIANNVKLVSLDLRMNEEVPETSEAMVQIQEIVRTNELNNR